MNDRPSYDNGRITLRDLLRRVEQLEHWRYSHDALINEKWKNYDKFTEEHAEAHEAIHTRFSKLDVRWYAILSAFGGVAVGFGRLGGLF